ncbi:MAG TPA: hypothetical protein VMM93_08140 [Vicinamibacterales bacterium]|nr:hypothetical protein [Vicinamibacterales bacterium]
MSKALACVVVAALPAVLAAHHVPNRGAAAPQIASGHTVLIVNGAERTFDFGAVRQADGSVSGQARLDNEATGLTATLALDCLVIDGNLARIGGTIVRSNFGNVGANVVFHAEDNGARPDDLPDRVSHGFITGASCETFEIPANHPGRLADLDRGAVHIRD